MLVDTRSSYKQRDLKLALKLQCAWPPSAWPSELVTGPSAVSLQSVLAAELCQVQQTRVISACWPILQRTDCQGVQLYNTDYRRMRSNRSQKFVVLWLKITFDITLSQLKFINLHNAVTYRF